MKANADGCISQRNRPFLHAACRSMYIVCCMGHFALHWAHKCESDCSLHARFIDALDLRGVTQCAAVLRSVVRRMSLQRVARCIVQRGMRYCRGLLNQTCPFSACVFRVWMSRIGPK